MLKKAWFRTESGRKRDNGSCYISGFFLLLLQILGMAATILSDTVIIPSTPETKPSSNIASGALVPQIDLDFVVAVCDCCGLTEECTPAYFERIRETHDGKWLCGLCAEAVKDEILRNASLVGTKEAMTTLRNFCKKSTANDHIPANPAMLLISALRQILKRSLDSRSALGSPQMNLHQVHGKNHFQV